MFILIFTLVAAEASLFLSFGTSTFAPSVFNFVTAHSLLESKHHALMIVLGNYPMLFYARIPERLAKKRGNQWLRNAGAICSAHWSNCVDLFERK